jgi:mRNA-degrading endonuclease toxin of MazEF toxin-antitoxin module
VPSPKPLRGEVWQFDLDPKKGREQKGVRPCLVVSTDALNRSAFGTAIVCPVTTTERPNFAWRVGLVPDDLRIADTTWQAKAHWVETDQIVTVDTTYRAVRHLATVVDEDKLRQVDESLRVLLDLT